MEKLKGSLLHKYLFFSENVCTLEKWVRVGVSFLRVKTGPQPGLRACPPPQCRAWAGTWISQGEPPV